MRIRTTFYSRENINRKWHYSEVCKGEIFGKNIWVENPGDLPGCVDTIANFEYLYSKTYTRDSNKKVNTHFKYKISRTVTYEHPVFAKLNCFERFKLKVIMGETGYQRNPIEFWLLVATFLGVFIGLLFGILSRCDQNSSQKQIIKELQELRKDINAKEFIIENKIILSDSLAKGKGNEHE